MNAGLRKMIKAVLSKMPVVRIFFGKNKGLKLKYSEDLNLDMLLGFHEPNTFEVFDLFVKPGMTVADIGANVGYFTRFLSKKVGDTGTIYAFEPIPATFVRLKDTLALNDLKNVVPVNKAVSDQDGIVTMYLSHTHYMASLDKNWASDSGGNVDLPCISLDSYFNSLQKIPDFIKMDIEGGGVFALKGMKNTIINHQPVLFLESHTPMEDLAIGNALSLADYDVYRVGSTVPVKYLDRNHTDPYGIFGTVIGIPKSKKQLFKNWVPAQFQKNRLGQRD